LLYLIDCANRNTHCGRENSAAATTTYFFYFYYYYYWLSDDIQQLFMRFGRELKVRALDNGINRASLLAQATVDAFGHINVVAGGSTRAIGSRFGFNRDCLSRACGLAQLACNASLLSRRIAAQCVLTTETGCGSTGILQTNRINKKDDRELGLHVHLLT
jgi:hypothetical protein